MENSNQNRSQHGDHKTNQKVNTGYKRNHASNQSPDKKIIAQKKIGEKLNKLFEHLAYQELDAD